MLRWLLRGVALALVLGVAALALALGCAHRGIRAENPPLPAIPAVLELATQPDRPVRLSWIETASQRDPSGAVIVHPVFVLEWRDGRILLVDAGMDAEAARAFGKPMEWLLGADPARPGRAVEVALAGARERVGGIVFTHLHQDHTQGLAGLCASSPRELRVFVTPAQVERANYTTAPGLAQLRGAGCAHEEPLADSGLAEVEGFGGVRVVRTAGHTPGSQVVVAWVGAEPRGYVLAGDAVFEASAIAEDRPKPAAYRWLVTPENEAQLARVRAWLAQLGAAHGFVLLPSHDRAQLEASALPRF